MDIVNAGCSTENVTEDVSDSTAVQAALDAVLKTTATGIYIKRRAT